jgi:ubiquinone biosynthesis monooxygenase Coq7
MTPPGLGVPKAASADTHAPANDAIHAVPCTIEQSAILPVTTGLTVYYDGACPLCRREIEFYRRRSANAAIDWVDASAGDEGSIAPDLKRAEALERFHVRLPDGRLESGARGFGELWAAVPGFHWLGRLALTRPAHPILEFAYRRFLRFRPVAQRIATNLETSSRRPNPLWLERELRSDHAGETGAVAIYIGILATSQCCKVREFARRHLETERRHVTCLEKVVLPRQRSKLLALWYVAGFITGALPAIFGSRAVYTTVEAIETFVDNHYRQQIEMLGEHTTWSGLRVTLEACREDEVAHRDEARRLISGKPDPVMRLWLLTVAAGSAAGVSVARRI